MDTPQALDAMTNVGKFELLATSVLRKQNADYESILHFGTSAGKPVKSPLDGFCLVPHSAPPHFLLVQHTTTQNKGLQRKWLHDHSTVKVRVLPPARKTKLPSESDDGDLIKAGREAQKLRKDYPEALFTVILATNRMISKALVDKVNKRATGYGVAVEFWDQARIADFLDTTSEGHYLRRKYLVL